MNIPLFPNQNANQSMQGITLRDYFAAQALRPVLDDFLSEGWSFANPELSAVVAQNCYEIAKAMMKAREA